MTFAEYMTDGEETRGRLRRVYVLIECDPHLTERNRARLLDELAEAAAVLTQKERGAA